MSLNHFELNKGCKKCGCCCELGFIVEVIRGLDNIPLDLRDEILYDGSPIWAMKMNPDKSCIAYDKIKKRCKIYKNRPMTCKTFVPGCNSCYIARKMMEDKT